MTQNYAMIDGKRIDFSKETTDSFKKALGIVGPKEVKVYNFRATKMNGVSYPYYLGGVLNNSFDPTPERTYCDNKAHISPYTRGEVEQIITGLQELLDS